MSSRYKIIYGPTLDDLEAACESLCAMGWRPVGGPVLAAGASDLLNDKWAQAFYGGRLE